MLKKREWTASQTPSHRVWVLVAMGASLVGMVGAGGCQKSVLRPKDNRSQYDQYDQSRGQRAQPFLEDEFGHRTPNLSERLLDRDN